MSRPRRLQTTVPLGDLAAGLLGTVARLLGQVFAELILEILIKGPGYLILRGLRRSSAAPLDPDDWRVAVAGIAFWGVIGGCAWWIYRSL